MLVKKTRHGRSSDRLVKKLDLKREVVNRKLIAAVFLLSGALSLGLWWKGRDTPGDESKWWEGWISPVEISFETGNRENNGLRIKKSEALIGEIRDRVATASGTYAVYVYEMQNRQGFGMNEREKMAGASVLKIPALVAAARKIEQGEWSEKQEFELLEVDRSPGSGPLQFEPAGTMVSVGDMLRYLGRNSDNTAWRMVNRLAGVQAVEDVMLAAGMTDSDYSSGAGDVTAVDVGKLLVKLADEEVVGNRGWQLMREYLTDSIYEDRIPAGIPEGEATIVHKVGTLADVWSDAGIVEPIVGDPFVVVVLNQGVVRAEATAMVPWIVEQVWKYQSGF